MNALEPRKRSPLRVAAGRAYYTLCRYAMWYFGNERYAKDFEPALLPQSAFAHQTPLLRELKNVDMWLQHNKVHNLQLAVKKINGLILKPGETLSYWKLIGNPTKRKGYLPGMVLFYGGFRPGTGGGLCQLSNLIYWITLHTPLTVVERHRHSYDVFPDSNRTQPFGSGATCVFNYRDLQITNTTHETYQLVLYLTDQNLCGEWRRTSQNTSRYEVYEREHRITHEYWGGYVRHNSIYRKEFDSKGTLVEDVYLTENHAVMMYAPFLEDGAN